MLLYRAFIKLNSVEMAEPEKSKQWQWKPASYKVRTWAGTLGALAAYGLGASLLLNPIGLIATTLLVTSLTLAFIDKNKPNPAYKPHDTKPAPTSSAIFTITRDIAEKMGMKEIPRVFIKHARPLLDVMSLFGGDSNKIKKALENDFSASPQQNVIEASAEALDAGPSARKLNYILAHEMSHIKNDKNNPALIAKAVTKIATPVLAVATISIGLFTGALPLAASLTGGKAILGLLLMTKGAKLFSHYGIRVTEKLADRNAMYITRDFNAAAAAIKGMHSDMPFDRKMPLMVEIAQTHPIGLSRIESLRKSWEEAITYPPLRAGDPTNDNQPLTEEKTVVEVRKFGDLTITIHRRR